MASLENLSEENLVEEIPQWKLAKQGLQLILNNKFSEGEAVLKNDPNSIHLFAGYTFAVFMVRKLNFCILNFFADILAIILRRTR